ncbi:MAG: tRNA (adenosine(37)-N6)-threonylcarbamoyltransferase complex dimerization subunit type 1 TsaB [Pseudomonadota bacterium]
MKILAFDTSSAHVTAGLFGYGTPLYEEMARGQAERLLPMCEEVLSAASLTFQELDAIAVGVGPGNFTGIRIAVSAARGLALSLSIPAIGVSGFEWLHQGNGFSGRVAVTLPAPRDQAYAQVFMGGKAMTEAVLVTPGIRNPALEQPGLLVAGYRAEEIAKEYNAEADETLWTDRRPHMMAATLALIASNKIGETGAWTERPAPLYVRAPDAAPPSDPPPMILP